MLNTLKKDRIYNYQKLIVLIQQKMCVHINKLKVFYLKLKVDLLNFLNFIKYCHKNIKLNLKIKNKNYCLKRI